MNVFIGGAIEIPAVLVTVWAMLYIGRRHTMAWGFVIAAVSNFLCIFVLDNEGWSANKYVYYCKPHKA